MAYKVIDVESHEWYVDRTYAPPPQYGPLRQYDKEMRCMKGTKGRRCNSSTFYKVNNEPRCMTHALRDLNEIVCNLTGEGPNASE